MNTSLAVRSMLLFGVCVVMLAVVTLAESLLGTMSLMGQEMITFLGIVLPGAIGCILGVMSLIRREGRPWLAGFGIVLNGAIAFFHLMIIFLAG